MANYHSSTGALSNLFIGLARGYRKEYRRLLRQQAWRKNVDPNKAKVEMRKWFYETLTAQLEGYFPKEQILLVAADILVMVDSFTEPPDDD